MALPDSWHLRTRSRRCSVTDTPFTEGQAIVTAIFPDPESSGYLRKDFADEAWNDRNEEDEKPFSHWHTKFRPTPVDETVPAVTKQTAEDLLHTLVEEDQEHTENTRYILAVMLERQKLLRETDTQPTTGGTLRIYEHRKTGEVYIVKDPNIPLDQVEVIQEEVIQLLSPKQDTEEETTSEPIAEATPATEEEAASNTEENHSAEPEEEENVSGETPTA
ncbi:MAG: hypothetical protein ACSHX9_01015 [Luteolibacter sp.]